MAGSYNHCVTEQGNLASPERLAGMLDYHDTGDVFEAVEEMYGMIWYLANMREDDVANYAPEQLVEFARQNYQEGLRLAKANKNKRKSHT
jgi:hypothetical protein